MKSDLFAAEAKNIEQPNGRYRNCTNRSCKLTIEGKCTHTNQGCVN
ncbi:MAG: hypothetical protein U0M95_08070 [Ruminococcus sp.]